MEEKLTTREVIAIVVNDLMTIKVPASEVESIGIPISRSISNLIEVIKAMDRAGQEAQKKAAQDVQGEPEIEMKLVPKDEVPEGNRQ